MKKLICIAMALMLLSTGCAAGGGVSSLTEDVEPEKIEAAEGASYEGAARFAMELLHSAPEGENLLISPASAYLCLAMVMNGAQGETLKEFESVMGASAQGVNTTARELISALAATAGSTEMKVADSAWADVSASISDEFLSKIATYYDAGVFSAELSSDAALKAINQWVNKNTNGLIPTLHDEPYPAGTMLVLLNTIYMKAKWETEFMGFATYDEDFTNFDGDSISVPFMHMTKQLRYIASPDGAEGVLLPYDDGETAFVALRPREGSATAFANAITAEQLAGYIAGATEQKVVLSMPKFTVEYSLRMNDMLRELGLTTLFDPVLADLSAMGSGENGPLHIDQVFQKVKIEVNEEGTEAAAVTEAAAAEGAYIEEEPPAVLTLDSPFLYAVIDVESGLPLFMGILNDPA